MLVLVFAVKAREAWHEPPEDSRGARQEAGLSNQRSQVTAESARPDPLHQPKRSQGPAALAEPDVENVRGARLDQPIRVLERTDCLISHDRDAGLFADAPGALEIAWRERLLDGRH